MVGQREAFDSRSPEWMAIRSGSLIRALRVGSGRGPTLRTAPRGARSGWVKRATGFPCFRRHPIDLIATKAHWTVDHSLDASTKPTSLRARLEPFSREATVKVGIGHRCRKCSSLFGLHDLGAGFSTSVTGASSSGWTGSQPMWKLCIHTIHTECGGMKRELVPTSGLADGACHEENRTAGELSRTSGTHVGSAIARKRRGPIDEIDRAPA